MRKATSRKALDRLNGTRLDPFAQTVDPSMIEPLTVRIPTAIRITGIGRSKLYQLIKAGEIETVKIGASTLLSMESLRRLVSGSRSY